MLAVIAPATSQSPPATSQPQNESTTLRDVRSGVEKLQSTGSEFIGALPAVGIAIGVLIVAVMLGRAIRWGVEKINARHDRPVSFAIAMGRLASGLLVVLGLLVAAVIVFPNFTPTKLLEFLGFGSVAVGFAFRDVLQNYLAGLLILFTQPFRIGDQIVFGNYEGTVMDIQTRATFVRTYDGRRVVIPNAELFTNSVLVNTAFEKRRIEYDVGIGYGDDIEHARQIMLAVLSEDESALDDPAPEVLVMELAGDHVSLRARWWIDPPQRRDKLQSLDSVLGQFKRRLTEAGIDLPFPTSQILLHDQTERTDGDRRRQREGWPSRKDDANEPT